MKEYNKTIIGGFLAAFIIALAAVVVISILNTRSGQAQVLGKKQANGCTTIQSGELLTSDRRVIETGFDEWGYNYQARMFNGGYCDAYRDAAWCQPYKDIDLIMKWNDTWLSNIDCDADGSLDRHRGFSSYIGSGAWLTNHQDGDYLDDEGKAQHWNYFVKIVAAPADAYTEDGFWYNSDGEEIGPVIWGSFAIIQQISNDSGTGEHGVLYKSPAGPGFGVYKP